jgi:hypothetical protein
VDQSFDHAKDFITSFQVPPQVENLHIGESSADLAFGSSKMPRICLVNKDGAIAYLGHPEKIKLEEAITNLIKGESLELNQQVLD